MDQNGLRVEFGNSRAVAYSGDSIVLTATLLKDDLYQVNLKSVASANLVSLETWHQRLGHLSEQNLKKLPNMVDGMQIKAQEHLGFCEICSKGKMAKSKHKKNKEIRTKQIGEIIHTDVWGPIEPSSIGGARYYVSFTDDFSRKSFVYFMKKKSEVVDIFISFHPLFENQSKSTIKKNCALIVVSTFLKNLVNFVNKKGLSPPSRLVIHLNRMV